MGAYARAVEESERTLKFATSIDPGTLYGVQSLDEAMLWSQGYSRITRREAISVPAIKRARDRIAGGVGQLPLRMYDGQNVAVPWSLLDSTESGRGRSVTWTAIVDDLLFYGVSWLRVTHVGWHGKPAEVARLDPSTVTVQPDLRVYYSRTGNGTALEWVPDEQLIRIESPNDPLLVAGARAIRSLTRLESAALTHAEGVPPMDYFTPQDSADPDNINDFLSGWQDIRRSRSTGYVPVGLDYHTNAGFNPEQLQMAQAREFAITEIARLTGIDTEELGVSTTSRTYFNAQDRRRQFVDFTLGPFMRAIEDRLSLDDVTPRGFRVRFDLADFLQPDDKTAAEIDQILLAAKVLTPNEVRERRGLQPLAEPIPTDEEDLADPVPTPEASNA
jgi:HK97 family phage portal protein